MPIDERIIMALILGSVAAVLLGGFLLLRTGLERRRTRLERRIHGPDSTESILLDQIEPSTPPSGWANKLDSAFVRMIERTGLPLNAEQALGLICLTGVCLALVLLLWRGELWLVMFGLGLGILMPLAIFVYLQARWQRQLQEQLPDIFFFLARSLRAGLNLEQALALVGDQGPKPLADQLRRCAEQISLGLSVSAALELTARRIHLVDFNIFVSVIGLHRTTGGNLPLLLDRLAASTRDRNQYRGYFRSVTSLGRLTATFLGLASPVILLGYAFLYPDYIAHFFETGAGLSALAVAFVLEVIGVIWLYLLLRVDY
jgi:tight adherence protein B